jgi:hypothetical protein
MSTTEEPGPRPGEHSTHQGGTPAEPIGAPPIPDDDDEREEDDDDEAAPA